MRVGFTFGGSATATSDGQLMMTLVSRILGYRNSSSPCADRGLDAVRELSRVASMASRRRDIALTPSRRRGLSDTPRSLDANDGSKSLKNDPGHHSRGHINKVTF